MTMSTSIWYGWISVQRVMPSIFKQTDYFESIS